MSTNPPTPKRWKVTLVDRTTFARRPRTKKRRIINKWRKRPENWLPFMKPVARMLIVGRLAHLRASGTQPAADPYHNEEDPIRPRWLEMHTLLWQDFQRQHPQWASLCDVFRRQTITRHGIQWEEDVPVI